MCLFTSVLRALVNKSHIPLLPQNNLYIHKQVGHKQENKHVLSSDYWAYINSGDLYTGGLIFGGGGGGGAYSWMF
jgi:hypothetical protein